jgi:hypothetical protein
MKFLLEFKKSKSPVKINQFLSFKMDESFVKIDHFREAWMFAEFFFLELRVGYP